MTIFILSPFSIISEHFLIGVGERPLFSDSLNCQVLWLWGFSGFFEARSLGRFSSNIYIKASIAPKVSKINVPVYELRKSTYLYPIHASARGRHFRTVTNFLVTIANIRVKLKLGCVRVRIRCDFELSVQERIWRRKVELGL